MERALGELRGRVIAATEKGFAALGGGRAVSAASLAAERPPLREAGFTYPLLTIRQEALERNVAEMAAYCAAAGVELAPHGKTAMAPQLSAAQLAAGAWGVTAATIDQVRVYRTFGVPRILLANELVEPAGIGWLAGELAADPGFDVYCYVDSTDGVAILDAALRAAPAGRPLNVLVELGQPGGRTGCRTPDGARAVVAAVDTASSAGTLRLAGVAGYEGGIGHDNEPDTLAAIGAYCARLRALADELRRPGEWIVSAGGSSFFDIVTRELTTGWTGAPATVVLRSGAYLTHDHGLYGRLSPGARHSGPSFTPALELWARVLSRPEPELALLGAGRRDVAFDTYLPRPLRTVRRDGTAEPAVPDAGWEVTALADQHAFLRLPADAPLSVGDLVCLGVSHPCTTFDKWRVIPVVDGADRVVDAVHTFF